MSAEIESGTDLVRRNGNGLVAPAENGLIPLDEVERALDELLEHGDTESLIEGRARADAFAAYERRQNCKERADYFGRVKILTEAVLGILDLQDHPWGTPLGGQWVIGDTEIGSSQRGDWRCLGQGRLQGMLDAVCDYEAADPAREVGTDRVSGELRRRGVGYVDSAALKDAIKKAASTRPGGLYGLAERAGISRITLRNHTEPRKRYVGRFTWPVAVKLCEELGLDVNSLPQGRKPSRIHRSRKRVSPARRLKGGRWDRAYSSHRRTMQEIFEITGEGKEPDLWAHLHAIEDFLKRRV